MVAPYGECREKQTDAPCSYMYGYAKAFDDAYLRSITNPEDYLWWLDVETGNTWSGDKDANRALQPIKRYLSKRCSHRPHHRSHAVREVHPHGILRLNRPIARKRRGSGTHNFRQAVVGVAQG